MNSSEIILYQADDGSRVRLRASGGTVWLTQAEMAGLYDTSVPNIAQIVRRVLADGEVTAETVNSELMVRAEGARRVRREIKVYNLDMILAATAIANDCVVVTDNEKDFAGLQIINPLRPTA